MSHFQRISQGTLLPLVIGAAFWATNPASAQTPPKANGLIVAPPIQNQQAEVAYWLQDQEQVRRRAALNLAEDMNNMYLSRIAFDLVDESFGATLQPVRDALRAQLDIPAGQGLLVTSLRSDGPSALAGLKQNDILLSLADKPLAAAEDLTKQLKAAGDTPAALRILRGGKPTTIQVRPIYHVTLGPAQERKTEYFIGVSIDSVDDSLRSQVELPAGQGVVVSEVIVGSPAEKAGIKKYDIVIELAGKPIDKPETLAAQVQVNQERPTTLKLIRAGKSVTLPIAGTVRKVEANSSQEAYRYWLVAPQQNWNAAFSNYITALPWQDGRVNTANPTANQELQQRLDQVEKELKALRKLESLEKELKALHESLERVNETLKRR